jgi:AraC-like DNA-binding protein
MPSTAANFASGIAFDRARLFDTRDVDEARDRCARVFNPHTLRVLGRGQRLHARMDHLPLGPLSLNRLTWGASVAVDPQRLDSYYLLSIAASGEALFHHDGRPTAVSARCAGLVSAAPRFHFTTSADFDQVVVRIEKAAVERGWQALHGRPTPGAIDFACALPVGGAAWRAIEPVLALLGTTARGDFDAAALPHLAARVEDMLVTMLLLHQPHSQGPWFERPARSLAVHLRRAEAFMLERLDQPLTLASVAAHCGVARRTLQLAFQNERGLGPMQWLRRQRLETVRGELMRAATPASVSQTALRFGFTHLGEFSCAYRQAFGETPTQTLRRRL